VETLRNFSSAPLSLLFEKLKSSNEGLTDNDATVRLKQYKAAPERKKWVLDLRLLLSQFGSPLVLILIAAVILAVFLGEFTNSVIILAFIFLSGFIGFWQERSANRAMDKLKSMVQVTASVKRNGVIREIPLNKVVSGDVVILNAGDIVPGDGRLIECNDLHINEAVLTGESFPTEKLLVDVSETTVLKDRRNSVFQGTSVINGIASALIVSTGKDTVLGQIAMTLENPKGYTSFEKGIRQFGYFLFQLTLAFTLVILLLNLYMGKPVIDSALFALALAIGITPELLPAIITISLSSGAKRMSQKQVVVKKLSAIHNLGALDIFCVDKTGTLTEGTVRVHSAVDIHGNISNKVLKYAHWNASFETGFTNPIDEAIRSVDVPEEAVKKVDEVPYDFFRKRLSVVVNTEGRHIMITKGAVKNILQVCGSVESGEGKIESIAPFREQIEQQYSDFGKLGLRAIAVSYKDVTDDPVINREDERDLIFIGFICLHDPPKPNIKESLKKLNASGIEIKVITGDSQNVATHLANLVGLKTDGCITGEQLRTMSDEALAYNVKRVAVFAETEPDQKERIVRVLQRSGHIVGFIGDGLNDVSALKAADVGVSVDTAADIARETADIVLLQKHLDVLHDGVIEGRKTFANSLKYIFITTSANFGNMFSVAVSSVFLSFLPLLPKQILLINLLSDLPAMALTSDSVDSETLRSPQKWNNRTIRNFMIVFGLQSAFFDFLTFFLLFQVFRANTNEFRTGWFIECVLTELLTLVVIRTKMPFYKNPPGKYVLFISIAVGVVTFLVTYPPFNSWFGFTPLSWKMLTGIALIILLYVMSAEVTKRIFFRKNFSGKKYLR
jgi:Mg2+-importing ATPase